VATIITLGVSVAVMWVVDKVVITNATLKEVIEQDMVLPTAVACAFLLATFLAASWLVH
jgi:ABC-type sulfate transport system permease component